MSSTMPIAMSATPLPQSYRMRSDAARPGMAPPSTEQTPGGSDPASEGAAAKPRSIRDIISSFNDKHEGLIRGALIGAAGLAAPILGPGLLSAELARRAASFIRERASQEPPVQQPSMQEPSTHERVQSQPQSQSQSEPERVSEPTNAAVVGPEQDGSERVSSGQSDASSAVRILSTGQHHDLASTALTRIEQTELGADLLQSLDGRGVTVQVLPDSEFERTFGEQLGDGAVGAFVSQAGFDPGTVAIRASLADQGMDVFTETMAHELAHAAQRHSHTDYKATYRSGVEQTGAAAPREDETELGARIIREGGAELVAQLITNENRAPGSFARVDQGELDRLEQLRWDERADSSFYNPDGVELTQVSDPVANGLIEGASSAL